MNKSIKKYETYISSPSEHWNKRLTWLSLNGKTPKHTTSIMQFNKETNTFASMPNIMSAVTFFNIVSSFADVYVNWVRSKETRYSKKEYDDMRNFFVGAMGEIFFYTIFEDVRCIIAPDREDVLHRYDVRYTTPTLKGDKDGGVDFTCLVNDIPSVIQVKFWNPFSKKGIGLDIIQKAYAEGVSQNFIDKNEEQNVFICFLGNECSVYRHTKKYKQYAKNVVAFGSKSLEETINHRNKVFWQTLKERLVNLNTDN